MAYSEDNLLLEAVRTLLVDDNSNTGESVREIHHYCEDRIVRSNLKTLVNRPCITMYTVGGPSDLGLPTRQYMLHLTVNTDIETESSQDILNNLAQRVIDLLDEKPKSLNDKVSENLRCRLVVLISNNFISDEDKGLNKRELIFRITLQKQITINC